MNQSYVYFVLSGEKSNIDFDPNIISNELGIKPTGIQKKRETLNSGGLATYSYRKLGTKPGKEYYNMREYQSQKLLINCMTKSILS